jgi:hypothetical protein
VIISVEWIGAAPGTALGILESPCCAQYRGQCGACPAAGGQLRAASCGRPGRASNLCDTSRRTWLGIEMADSVCSREGHVGRLTINVPERLFARGKNWSPSRSIWMPSARTGRCSCSPDRGGDKTATPVRPCRSWAPGQWRRLPGDSPVGESRSADHMRTERQCVQGGCRAP